MYQMSNNLHQWNDWPSNIYIAQTMDLVTFTEEILNGKVDFLCSVICSKSTIEILEIGVKYVWS